MAAVLSSSHSSSPNSPNMMASVSNPNLASLPPLVTSSGTRRSNVPRPNSLAKNRISAYSTSSIPSQSKSRPASHAFPIFHSSLPYALVRDFAYPPIHPLHYGPPPHSSGLSTPASETRRLSDPSPPMWDIAKGAWSATSSGETSFGGQQLPAMAFGDGPPYSEDEDLQSPVVTTSRHRKHKSGSGMDDGRRGRSPQGISPDGGGEYYPGSNGTDYSPNDQEYLSQQLSKTYLNPKAYHQDHRDSHFATGFPSRVAGELDLGSDSDEDYSDPEMDGDESRYSKDYQFTIASPDEEMHGKAVALFDFTREHENELPLAEGQVIWVSYRHGQGWLVAEDPKTGESGLVPEEYVRLVRDIEGGLRSLTGEVYTPDGMNLLSPTSAGPDSASTPTQSEPRFSGGGHHPSIISNGNNGEKRPPVVSTFSTSSRDLDPYPQHLLATRNKTSPPQISQEGKRGSGKGTTTPVLSDPPADAKPRNEKNENVGVNTHGGER